MTRGPSFLRDNAFLVAAVSLPVIVVAFFLASTAIPRWLVPPPAYDVLIRATDLYNGTARMSVDFSVRDDGKVEARVRAVPPNTYAVRSALFLYDHTTMTAREIPIELPDNLVEGDPPRIIVVDSLAGRRAVAQAKAPDGYELVNRSQRGPGIVGELFGMNRYNSESALVNRGRVVQITLPAPYQNQYSASVSAVGWLVDEGAR
jgi:hypothetical protein